MNFKLWLEKLELLSKEYIPDEKTSSDPAEFLNPQYVKAYRKNYETTTYTMPVKDDAFIHFAPKEFIQKIFDSKKFGQGELDDKEGYPNYAISTTFGRWFPNVQYGHISSMLPNALYITDIKKKNYDPNKRIPDFGKEIDAILFKTNEIPDAAYPEEIIWIRPIKIEPIKILTSREAINILKHTPEKIHNESKVKYT